VPHITVPHITVPHITVPYITLPHITLPHITVPHITVPHITVPHITVPYFSYLTPCTPTKSNTYLSTSPATAVTDLTSTGSSHYKFPITFSFSYTQFVQNVQVKSGELWMLRKMVIICGVEKTELPTNVNWKTPLVGCPLLHIQYILRYQSNTTNDSRNTKLQNYNQQSLPVQISVLLQLLILWNVSVKCDDWCCVVTTWQRDALAELSLPQNKLWIKSCDCLSVFLPY
jgi:hypothetical protein